MQHHPSTTVYEDKAPLRSWIWRRVRSDCYAPLQNSIQRKCFLSPFTNGNLLLAFPKWKFERSFFIIICPKCVMVYCLRSDVHGNALRKHLEAKNKNLTIYSDCSGRKDWRTLFQSTFVNTQKVLKKIIQEIICNNKTRTSVMFPRSTKAQMQGIKLFIFILPDLWRNGIFSFSLLMIHFSY